MASAARTAGEQHQSWPALDYETLSWQGAENAFSASSFLSGMAGRTYQAAVPPEIRDSRYRVPPAVASFVAEAAQAIVRFDHEFGEQVRPFATLLLRSESVASSQIENLTANARSLGEAELGVEDRQNASLVVRNVRAMEVALRAATKLDEGAILDMHRALMEGTSDADVAGQWRQEQAWIGTSAVSPVGAAFVPPEHSRVPALMADLMEYVRRTDVPPLEQAALAHAQFETIHPFTDGNGRTGRALLHSMLKARGVAAHATVPISAGLLADTEGYHHALTRFREGEPEPIIVLCAQATFRAIHNGTQLAQEVSTITEGWHEKVTARSDSAVWPVLDLLARQPVVNVASLEGKLGLEYMRMKRAMDALEQAGIVIGVNKHKRGRFWRAPEMLVALDSFAARAGNRVRS